MSSTLHLQAPRQIATTLVASLLLLSGCGKTEQIQTYTVPKEPTQTPVAAATNVKPGEPTDRMLAAILPSGQTAWFFKAVGPIAEIDKHEKAINDFFTSLTLGTDGRATWKLPEGWKEEGGTGGFRLATIVIPGDKRVEITVNTTPWPGTEESMLANVNRWRGQLQLAPIAPAQIPEVSHPAEGSKTPLTIVDLRGQFQSGGMTPPFAGAAAGGPSSSNPSPNGGLPDGHPPIDAVTKAPPLPSNATSADLPAGHPPIDPLPDSGPAAPPAVTPLPKFTAPASWKSVPAQGMRRAEFAVGDGAEPAKLTMFEFPIDAGPMISDPLVNINRWRGEIGLSPLTKETVAAATQSIDVDGTPAIYAPMIPDVSKPQESQTKEATLAAIVKAGNQVWFVKLRGERELVKKHEDEFKSFLKSFKFSPEKEAGNGNK